MKLEIHHNIAGLAQGEHVYQGMRISSRCNDDDIIISKDISTYLLHCMNSVG